MAVLSEAADFETLNTADGMFVVDREQVIVHWNDSAERILGFSRDQVIGRRCYEVLAGRERQNRPYCRRDCPVISKARRGRVSENYDLCCVTADGQARWLNIGILIPNKGPMKGCAVHLFRDVTERRKVEEFARRAARVLRELRLSAGDEAIDADPSPTPTPSLSRRENEVLRLLATGMKTKQIAEALGIRPLTARNHISRLLNKLGAESRLEAILYASQRGII